MITTVADSGGLLAALKSAHSGDTIQLAAGNYSGVSISNLHFDSAVTIESKIAGSPAVLNDLALRGVSGLIFKNLEFVVDANKPDHPFIVSASKNIAFDHLNVHGSLDNNPQNDNAAMLLRDSTNVTVTNSEFHDLRHGIAHLNDTKLTITGNYFHDIRSDGVLGGGSSHVLVSQNYFTDFRPNGSDHPDAIQFWTTNTTVAAHDITVSNNVIMRGAGAAIQGIFISDQVGTLPYGNLKVADNLIIGGLYNGITVGHADSPTINGNQVYGLPDQQSSIRVGNSTDVRLSNNQTTHYSLAGNDGVTEVGDTTASSPKDGGKAILAAWMTAHRADATSLPPAARLDNAADLAVRAIETVRLQAVVINGTAGADRLMANATHNSRVDGGAGDDILTGGGIGHNLLVGGAGNDTFVVRSDFDLVSEQFDGGADQVNASIDFALPDNVENLRLTGGATTGIGNDLANRIIGTSSHDTLAGLGGADALQGNDGNDFLSGGDSVDTLTGGAGDDTLTGEAASDMLNGSEGADSIAGGAGGDTIEGGAGSDTISGGAQADLFRFRPGDLGATNSTADKILDFSAAEGDRIAVNMIDANTLKAGEQAFTYIGAQPFHRVAGELHYETAGGDIYLAGDTNGDGIADIKILLAGLQTFGASSIIL